MTVCLTLLLISICNFLSVFPKSEQVHLQKLLFKADDAPINLLFKPGIDSFKDFLVSTMGEKNLLLWIEVEKAKYYNAHEKKM